MLAQFKAPTTANVSDGIENAVRQVMTTASVPPESVSCVSIGTTAFINAVLEADARRLTKVAVVRISGPYTRQCPPFIDFPPRLRPLIEGYVDYVDGGMASKSSVFLSSCISSSLTRKTGYAYRRESKRCSQMSLAHAA